jgi:hypothetical protein
MERAFGAAVRFQRPEILKLLIFHGAGICDTLDLENPHSETQRVLYNWTMYLPRWNRFVTHKYYPGEFTKVALHWLLCCKRLKVFCKDLQYLILEYIAENWKEKKA